MPVVEALEDAVILADAFLARFFSFRRLEKARLENGIWVIEFDVGPLTTIIAQVRIDANSGKVVGYTKTGMPL